MVSPGRPHQSPSASPSVLLVPDPPPVDEVLQQVGQELLDLPPQVVGAGSGADNEAPPDNPEAAAAPEVIMVNYDQQNEDDDAGAIQNVKIFKPSDP